MGVEMDNFFGNLHCGTYMYSISVFSRNSCSSLSRLSTQKHSDTPQLYCTTWTDGMQMQFEVSRDLGIQAGTLQTTNLRT